MLSVGSETPPPIIPGYVLGEKIGEGGMGQVYRAIQVGLQRTVAVKYLNPLPRVDGVPSDRQRESQLMAALDHPNVVAVYESGEVEGRQYLVMEYVAGRSLRTAMEPDQPWDVGRALPVLDAVAGALSYIHDQGILHLDLKPENVLCTPEGQVKVSDFGLALRRVDIRTLSHSAVAQGTLDYAAPEQIYGLGIDVRCDVFSLATLAYELLAGRLPGRVFVPATVHNPHLPAAANDVLRRGLARDPDERYPTVEDFRRELAAALTGTDRADVLHVNLPDRAATTEFGHRLAKLLFPGAVVALIGPLGAGKTHLVRAVAEGLGVRDSRVVNSPTFVLIQEYAACLPIYHFDAYRLRGAAEFEELGAREYFEGDGVCLVEWADRVEEGLPAKHLRVELSVTGENSRRAVVERRGSRYAPLVEALRAGG